MLFESSDIVASAKGAGHQPAKAAPGPARREPPRLRAWLAAVDSLGQRLTPRQRLLAAFRAWTLATYSRRQARRDAERHAWYVGARRNGRKLPPRLTAKRFRRAWRRVAKCYGVGLCDRAVRSWTRQAEAGGLAALVDFRGCHGRHRRAGVDGVLWRELWRRLLAGDNVASVDRSLRPAARARGLAWPSLSTLRARLRGLRRATARNGHLLCGSRN